MSIFIKLAIQKFLTVTIVFGGQPDNGLIAEDGTPLVAEDGSTFLVKE